MSKMREEALVKLKRVQEQLTEVLQEPKASKIFENLEKDPIENLSKIPFNFKLYRVADTASKLDKWDEFYDYAAASWNIFEDSLIEDLAYAKYEELFESTGSQKTLKGPYFDFLLCLKDSQLDDGEDFRIDDIHYYAEKFMKTVDYFIKLLEHIESVDDPQHFKDYLEG